jgi:prevent-host-death family protein
MKTITSKEAQNSFNAFLDTAQHEPVVVTRSNRPVGVMLSMENLPSIFELADSMKATIKTGIKAGLDDAKANKGQELTSVYIHDLKTELQAKIKFNNSK